MVQIPAICRDCGSFIPEPGFVEIGEGSTFVGVGNTVTCPVCGEKADLLDGTYGAIDHALVMLSGPEWSVDVLKKVRAILQNVGTQAEAERAVEEIEDVAPQLAAWVRRVAAGWTTANTLTAIQIVVAIAIPLLTTWLILGGRPTDPEVQQNIQQKVTEELDRRLREQPPTTPPSLSDSTLPPPQTSPRPEETN